MNRGQDALDFWIRQSLRDTHDPLRTLGQFKDALAQNAVDLGFIEHADGSWRWAGEWTWGPGIVTLDAVPYLKGE